MAKVLDAKTQKEIEIPDDEVTQAVASGAVWLPKGEVDVRDALGRTGTVDAAQASEAFRQGMTYRPASEVEEERQRALYGDRPIAAGIAAAARGATLGASDVIAAKTGLSTPEELRGLEDQNTAASVVGELGGTAAATLLTAGGATPAALAARGAARAGATFAEMAGGRAVVRLAVEGGVEGGLQGLGRSLTNAAQERDPLTAEKVLANVGEGALFGLATGAGAGKLEEALVGRAGRHAGEELLDAGEDALGFEPMHPNAPEALTPAEPPLAAPRANLEAPLQSAGGLEPPLGPKASVLPGEVETPAAMGGGRGGGGEPPEIFMTAEEAQARGVRAGDVLDSGRLQSAGGAPPPRGPGAPPPPGEIPPAGPPRGPPRGPGAPETPSGGSGAPPGRPPAGGPPGGPPVPPDMGEAIAAGAKAWAKPMTAAIEKNPTVWTRLLEAFGLKPPTSTEWILRGLDVKKKGAERLRVKGLLERGPRTLLEDARFRKVMNPEEAFDLAQVIHDEQGAIVRHQAAHLDRIVQAQDQLDVEAFARRAREELIAPLARGTVDQRSTADRLEREVSALLDRAETLNPSGGTRQPPGLNGHVEGPDGHWGPRLRLGFAEGEDYKRALDASARWDQTVPNAHREGLRDLRRIFNEAQEQAATNASQRVGSEAFATWKAAKERFGPLAELLDVTADRVKDAKLSNRLFSLTDNLAAMVGTAAGGLNPAGLALGLGAALLNKWGRESLPFIMARAMAEYEGSPAVQQAARGLMNRFRRSGPGPGAVAGLTPTPPTPGGGGVQAMLDDAMRMKMNEAAQRGPMETYVMHSVLSGSVEYRAMAEQEGFAHYSRASDAAGAARGAVMARATDEAARFDARADAATRALLAGKRGPVRPVSLAKTSEQAHRLVEAAKNPDAIASRLAQRLSGVGARYPGLADSLTETAQRAQMFLASKAPARPVSPLGDVKSLRDPWKPSDVELERWGAYVRAVEDPASVLADAARGHLSHESVEALGAVYPALLEDLRGRVITHVSAHGKAIPYTQRLAVGQLLGMSLDASTQPRFLASMQSIYAGQGPGQPPVRSPAPSGARTAARIASEFSPADSIGQRGA